MDDNGMYIANNMTGVGPENGGYAFHFMAILKRIKSENDDSSVGHGHSGSITHTHMLANFNKTPGSFRCELQKLYLAAFECHDLPCI